MQRSLRVFVSALALALVTLAAAPVSALAQTEHQGFAVYPTVLYIAPDYLLGAEFNLGPITMPVVYGNDTLWLAFESSPVGKFWTVGFLMAGLTTPNPSFDIALGLGMDWGNAFKAMGCITSTGNYFIAFGFTLTLW